MKNIQSNLAYFKISQDNPEKTLDTAYMFTEENSEIAKYIENTKEIKRHLITIKLLLEKKENKKTIDRYFLSLANTLNKFSTCSEFSCFINACDNTLDLAKKDLVLLKKIAKKYFKNRLLTENTPEEWIQAILDSNSGRKKGSCAENKLINILLKQHFLKVNTWEDFNKNNKVIARFSSVFNLKNVRKTLNIKINTKKQNKGLDLLIKNNTRIFLLEAKHLNTSGGGQDKQLSELIELISLTEKNKNISYIAFLDGNYSNVILNNPFPKGKLKTQKIEIAKFLKKNPNNYWLNTQGFKALFSAQNT